MNIDFHNYLTNRIDQDGPLTISQYMNLCLYHPEFGYYKNFNPLGQKGDFVTAPEISQIFGELIGLCFMDVWQRMGEPEHIHLIELGPGQGTLMQDFLRAVSSKFRQAIDLHLVDISPILKKEQRQRINHAKTHWHDDIEAAYASCQQAPIFVVANEFYDALPIHQFERKAQGWYERMVTVEDDQYKMISLPATNESLVSRLPHDVKPGDIVEVCEGARYITQSLTQQISRQGGLALIFDYGYGAGTYGDTLQSVRAHKKHDFLVDPGTADLTAHVDFHAIADIAEQQGAIVYGPTTQGNFLTELGIDVRAAQLKKKSALNQNVEIDKTIHRLTHETQMGSLFKAIAITSPQTPEPCGFKSCTKQAA